MTIDLAHAAAAAQAAIASGARTAENFNTLAWFRLHGGDAQAAADLFTQALHIAPRDPEALVGLAGLLRGAGRLRDAALHCDAAIAAAPAYAEAWLERAYVMAAGGVMDEAARCYGAVLEIAPAQAAAHAGLAAIAARDGDGEKVRRHAGAALASEPANPIAAAALATVQIEAGDAAGARALVEPLVATLHTPSPERIQLLTQLGDACDKLDDAEAAYAAYSAANADFAVIHAGAFAERQSQADFIAGIAAGIAAMDPSRWDAPQAAAPAPAAHHVFVLGYPRSGNTLLENVLASLPGAQALEERPTLREAEQAFLADPAGLTAFEREPDAALDRYRDAYWQRVAQAGVGLPTACFVDMDPLKGMRLPLIARLFPQARVLLVRRDPRDVVWSCFRTSFALTNAALDFTTLESTARHYDALMRLIETARERLPLAVHEVHYHRLVQDFDETTRELCAFIGMPWSEDLRRFDRTARKRGVSTASAGQVRRGLYDGTRQWERHARALEPVMPILMPWVERFGYG